MNHCCVFHVPEVEPVSNLKAKKMLEWHGCFTKIMKNFLGPYFDLSKCSSISFDDDLMVR